MQVRLKYLICMIVTACDPARDERVGEHHAPIVVGSEFALDNPVPAPAPGSQQYPGVSCVGDACLVVWQSVPNTQPHAARVDAASGVIADTYGIAVPGTSTVSCTGNVCLLAWNQLIATGDVDVWGLRVDGSTGAILDSAPIPIRTAPGYQHARWVSCCATQCLVLWDDSATSPPTGYGTRIDAATGAVFDPTGILISPSRLSAAADCIGSDWMVARADMLGTRVSADGTVLDQPPFDLAAAGVNTQNYSLPRISCASGTCLVVWADYRGSGIHIYASRVDAATGTLLDASDLLIDSSARTQNPSVSCYGTQCLMVWQDSASSLSGNVYGARIDLSTGVLADSPPIHIYTQCVSEAISDQEYPVVSCGSTDCLVAWQCRFTDYNVYAGRVSLATGTVSDPSGIIVSLAPNRESIPTAFCDGTGCVAVWLDSRDPPPQTPRAYGVRVDPSNGTVLDAQAAPMSPYLSDRQHIACGTSECLLVWENPAANSGSISNAVAAVRIDRTSGLVIDGSAIFLEAGVDGLPNVGCSGDECVVVWSQFGTAPMKITRVNLTTGAVSDPGGADFLPGLAAAVSCDSGVCLIAWEASSNITASRIDLATGSVLDPSGIAMPSMPYSGEPAVSCSAATCLIVWPQSTNSTTPSVVRAARVDLATGALDDANALAIATTGLNTPANNAVACEGSDCLVVWTDVNGGNRDLFAARFDNSSGTLLDPNGFALTATPELESSPALATDGAGHFLLLYSRPDSGLERVKARILALLPLGQPCTDNAQCFSGLCATGQCATPSPITDAGPADAELADAGVIPADATILDAETPDAPTADAAARDAATPDATMFDAATADARTADAATDAPTNGTTDATGMASSPDGGCGCQVGGVATTSGTILASVFALLIFVVPRLLKRRLRVAMLLFAVFAGSACLDSAATTCGTLTCPAGTACAPAGDRCVSPDQVAACSGKADGTTCSDRETQNGQCWGGSCEAVRCGNGRVEMGETCDDANTDSGDGCSSTCQIERCGNGVRDAHEGCDCGDGTMPLPTGCSGPNSNDPAAECRIDCQLPGCGDGVVEGLEECEPAAPIATTCQQFGFYGQGSPACTQLCRFDTTGCGGRCGDGVKNGPEACDGADFGSADCTTLGFYNRAGLACNESCGFDTSACTGFCGDGIVNGPELCDGAPPPGACIDYGYDAGALGCVGCAINLQGCKLIGWKPVLGLQGGIQSLFGWPNDVYAAYSGSIAHYDGQTWTTVYTASGSPSGAQPKIWGSGPNDLYAVGSDGLLVHYDGSSFQRPSWAQPSVWSIWGSSPSDVWLTRGNGLVDHFDGANVSSTLVDLSGFRLGDIWASGPSDVFAIGYASIYHFDGTRWSRTDIGSQPASRVWGSGPTDVFVSGDSPGNQFGGLMHFDGTGWQSLAGMGAIGSIAGTGPQNVWAAYHENGILRYDGTLFTVTKPRDTFEDVSTVFPLSNGQVIASGQANQGTLYVYHGAAWAPTARDISSLEALAGSEANDLFAVGAGTVLSYDVTFWHLDPVPTSERLTGAWSSAGNDRFAVGTGGVILHYDGTSWSGMASGITSNLWGVWGSGPSDVYAVGQYGRILHYDGTAWSRVQVANQNWTELYAIWGDSPTDIYAVGAAGAVAHYDGTAWTAVSPRLNFGDLVAVSGSGPTDVYAAGNGSLLRFDGTSWTALPVQNVNYTKVVASAPNNVWAIQFLPASGASLIHYNGSSWSPGQAPPYPVDIHMLPSGVITALYPDGSVYSATGPGGFDWPLVGPPNPVQPWSLWAAGENDVWAAGGDFGHVVHFDGNLWSLVQASYFSDPSAFGARRIWGASANDLFVLGDSDVVRFDGSSTPIHQNVPTPTSFGGFLDLWGSSSTDVFAVGFGGTIDHFDGSTWRALPSGTSQVLSAVWGSGPSDVFAVGRQGTILHYAGSSFTAQASGVSVDLNSIWGASPVDVFAVGNGGTALHFDGTQWTTMQTGIGFNLTKVGGTSGRDVFAMSRSELLHYDGSRWAPVRLPSTFGWAALLPVGDSIYLDISTRLLRTVPW